MSNFLKDLKDCIGGEIVEAVVFPSLMDSWRIAPDSDPRNKGIVVDKVYSWKEAQPLLDYEYDSGFGSADCHFVNIYTDKSVIYIHEYDGSTTPHSVPRNPPVKS